MILGRTGGGNGGMEQLGQRGDEDEERSKGSTTQLVVPRRGGEEGGRDSSGEQEGQKKKKRGEEGHRVGQSTDLLPCAMYWTVHTCLLLHTSVYIPDMAFYGWVSCRVLTHRQRQHEVRNFSSVVARAAER